MICGPFGQKSGTTLLKKGGTVCPSPVLNQQDTHGAVIRVERMMLLFFIRGDGCFNGMLVKVSVSSLVV